MAEPDYTALFEWVTKREAIAKRRREGAMPPWSDDPILANYRFCNVRREDDTVTKWIRLNIREVFGDHQLLFLMLCIARQVNWPETLASLIQTPDAWPSGNGFSPGALEAALGARAAKGLKVWTGAYVIAAGSVKGVAKHTHVAHNVLAPLFDERLRFTAHFAARPSLESTHTLLASFNGWGAFMAYQAVVDMRFTRLLCDAGDIGSWAAAGPGTLRGLNRLHGRALNAPIRQTQALDEIRAIDRVVRAATGVDMDFSDIPNILCETDKYLRVRNGEGKPRAGFAASASLF
jgi:hypothetical protein